MKMARVKDELKETRRYLHRIPEPAFKEHKTAAYIKNQLTDMGYRVERVAKTGVLAFKKGTSGEGPVCFRADMDALPGEEKTGLDFASNSGYMHSCGHDGHMAILLGFARTIADVTINRSILFLFQPGEENAGGADVVMQDENFKKYAVAHIFGLHIQPEIEEGKVGSKPGPFMAQTIEFNISIEGISCHGAQPHKGVDAIYAAAKLIDSYQSIISRNIDPLESAVLTIGTINGGRVRNLIAENVKLEGTLRSFNLDVYRLVKKRMLEINKGLEEMHNVKIETDFFDFCPPVVNNTAMFNKFMEVINPEEFVEMKPMTLSEDFGFYQLEIPGLFLMLGSKNDEKGFNHPLHSSKFNFDEGILLSGVDIFKRIAKKYNIL